MRKTAGLISLVLSVALSASLHATTYGSVEPIANQAVIDTTPLLNQPLLPNNSPSSRPTGPPFVRFVWMFHKRI